ncbi:MAG: hypothetical protein WBV72_03965, partial [Nitrososphaeraceae archaeon]
RHLFYTREIISRNAPPERSPQKQWNPMTIKYPTVELGIERSDLSLATLSSGSNLFLKHITFK